MDEENYDSYGGWNCRRDSRAAGRKNFFHIALDAAAYKSALLKPAPGTEKAEKRTGEGKKCRKKQ